MLFTAKCRSLMNNDMSSYLTTFSVHIISCTCVTLFLLMTWPCVVSPASAVALLFAKCRALFRAIFSFWVSLWSRVHSILHAGRLRIFFMYIIYIYIYISTIYLYRELALETSFWDVRRTSARLYIKWYFLCQITFIVYLDYLYDFSMLYSLTDCPMHPSGTLHTAMWDCLWTVFYRACSFPYQRHAPVVLFFSGKRKLLTVILSVHAFGCYKKGITTLFRHIQSFVRLVLVCAESWSSWIGSGFLHYLVCLFVYVP